MIRGKAPRAANEVDPNYRWRQGRLRDVFFFESWAVETFQCIGLPIWTWAFFSSLQQLFLPRPCYTDALGGSIVLAQFDFVGDVDDYYRRHRRIFPNSRPSMNAGAIIITPVNDTNILQFINKSEIRPSLHSTISTVFQLTSTFHLSAQIWIKFKVSVVWILTH